MYNVVWFVIRHAYCVGDPTAEQNDTMAAQAAAQHSWAFRTDSECFGQQIRNGRFEVASFRCHGRKDWVMEIIARRLAVREETLCRDVAVSRSVYLL